MGNPLSVIIQPQTYVNTLYLLLSFPLGIAYFVFLVTGLSVGFGLLVIWVGVPILALVMASSWALCRFEQETTNLLLKTDISKITSPITAQSLLGNETALSAEERLVIRMWRRTKAHLSNRLTWTGMLYLFLKFPIGIASFIVVVVLVSLAAGLLGAPFYYWVDDGIDIGIWQIDVLWEALVLTVAGIPATFIALHLINGTAYVSGRIAHVMLGKLQ